MTTVDQTSLVGGLLRAAVPPQPERRSAARGLLEAAGLAQRRRFLERMVPDGLPDLRDADVSASAWR